MRAEDNGRGFDPQAVAPGLDLRTVRDAVALLGGTVAIDSILKHEALSGDLQFERKKLA